MRRASFSLFLGLGLSALLLAGCRTGGTPGEVEPIPTTTPTPSDAKAPPGAATKVEVPGAAQGEAPPSVKMPTVPLPEAVSGFDLRGSSSCLPLPNDRHCIARHDPLVAACQAAKGELKHCEDCSYLCSRSVK